MCDDEPGRNSGLFEDAIHCNNFDTIAQIQGSPLLTRGGFQLQPAELIHGFLLRHFRRCFAILTLQGHLEFFFRTFAQDRDLHLIARALLANFTLQGRGAVYGHAVHFLNHIALADTGFLACASIHHFGNVYAIERFQSLAIGKILVDVLNGNAEKSALHLAVVHQIVYHLLHQVHRYGKAITHIAAGFGGNGGVDANQFARSIHKCSTAVARIDGRIGLNKVLDGVFIALAADDIDATAQRAHDTRGYGAGQVERIANGNNPFSYFHDIAVAVLEEGQVVLIDAQQGDIGIWIGAHELGHIGAFIVQDYFDFIGTCDHVVVGDDIPIGGNDDTGTTAIARLVGHFKAEVRVVEEPEGIELLWLGTPGFCRACSGFDVHHCRCRQVGHAGKIECRRALDTGKAGDVGRSLLFPLYRSRCVDVLYPAVEAECSCSAEKGGEHQKSCFLPVCFHIICFVWTVSFNFCSKSPVS